MTLSSRLLVGRFLTRSGDQAWDFAIPIVLLKILPDQLKIAALYYLLIRLVGVLLLPRVAALIDSRSRDRIVRLGLGLQFLGVLAGAFGISWLSQLPVLNSFLQDPEFLAAFLFLVFSGILGSLGSSLMDIAIASDLAPSVFSGVELSQFNSRFRQVDLLTEVGAPVLAGLLISIGLSGLPLFGFLLVAVWNLLSFFPEYGILHSVFQAHPDLSKKPIAVVDSARASFLRKLTQGWRQFFKEPLAPAMLAYALLWLSVLSPHGVLLTGFLQDGWRMPEWLIGAFRGSGAFFGLLATILFPIFRSRLGLTRASLAFLFFQALMVVGACVLFVQGAEFGQIGFLVLILFSRVGLYGFSLGEMQLRQELIAAESRGRINGFASALTGVATLLLFAFGALLPSTEDFKYLVFLSTACVTLALMIYGVWCRKPDLN